MMTQAYPLQWPKGRSRTLAQLRKRPRFTKGKTVYGNDRSWTRQEDITVAEAIKRLVSEADRIGADGLVISTNLELRNDGLPRSGQRAPVDPGVCAYFSLDGKPRAMPCDTYEKVEGNIAAIAAHIEATRAIERHGVATVAEMFAGFAALPAPSGGVAMTLTHLTLGPNDCAVIVRREAPHELIIPGGKQDDLVSEETLVAGLLFQILTNNDMDAIAAMTEKLIKGSVEQ